MIPSSKKNPHTLKKQKKLFVEKGEKKVKIFSKFFPLFCSFSLSLSIFTIFLSLDSAFEEAATLFSLVKVSLFMAYFEHRRRESERVASFFDRNEIIHLPFGMKDDDKEEEIFLSSV